MCVGKCLRTGDRLHARSTPLGKEFTKALSAVGLVVPGGEALASQRRRAVRASEALAMPRLVLVRHSALSDDLKQSA